MILLRTVIIVKDFRDILPKTFFSLKISMQTRHVMFTYFGISSIVTGNSASEKNTGSFQGQKETSYTLFSSM